MPLRIASPELKLAERAVVMQRRAAGLAPIPWWCDGTGEPRRRADVSWIAAFRRVDVALQRRDGVVAVDGDVGGEIREVGRIGVRDARRFLHDQRARLRHGERAASDQETEQSFHVGVVRPGPSGLVRIRSELLTRRMRDGGTICGGESPRSGGRFLQANSPRHFCIRRCGVCGSMALAASSNLEALAARGAHFGPAIEELRHARELLEAVRHRVAEIDEHVGVVGGQRAGS